jgi:hypothetical protein
MITTNPNSTANATIPSPFVIVCTESLTKSHLDLPMGHAFVVMRDVLQNTTSSSSAGVSTAEREN